MNPLGDQWTLTRLLSPELHSACHSEAPGGEAALGFEDLTCGADFTFRQMVLGLSWVRGLQLVSSGEASICLGPGDP